MTFRDLIDYMNVDRMDDIVIEDAEAKFILTDVAQIGSEKYNVSTGVKRGRTYFLMRSGMV